MNNLGTIAVLVAAGLLVWFLFFRQKQQPVAKVKQKPSASTDNAINVGVLWQPSTSVSERLSKTTNQLGLALETYCKTNPGVGICPTV